MKSIKELEKEIERVKGYIGGNAKEIAVAKWQTLKEVLGLINNMLKKNDEMINQGKVLLPKNVRIPFINGEELKQKIEGK